MIATEEEAKTKRCCGPEGCGNVRVSADLDGVYRPVANTQLCIGSACMAWRWFGVVSTMLVDVNLPPPKHGYCGYARHG